MGRTSGRRWEECKSARSGATGVTLLLIGLRTIYTASLFSSWMVGQRLSLDKATACSEPKNRQRFVNDYRTHCARTLTTNEQVALPSIRSAQKRLQII